MDFCRHCLKDMNDPCRDQRKADVCSESEAPCRSAIAVRKASILREIAADLRAHADDVQEKGYAALDRAALLRWRAQEIEAEGAACAIAC